MGQVLAVAPRPAPTRLLSIRRGVGLRVERRQARLDSQPEGRPTPRRSGPLASRNTAVVSAPVANILSHFGTSDSGYYVTPYAMAGEVWEAREKYHALSPVEYLEHATTPTLILQGEEDQRCPIGQAEEVFATLIRAGKAPVEFVRYPGGDHHLAEQGPPSHRIDYTRRIVEGVERWSACRS
ncbi:alpha/beta hydrolase family protein [Nannocystis exedens]|nr:prolyl oligopeptidase family serine peptidase [Nannocystis exedens]